MAGSDESPWASPGDPYPPAPQTPAPQTPAPQQVSPPSPYATPYAAPSPYDAPPGYATQAPPAWAAPPPIPPHAARSGLDPYRIRGWRGGGSVALRLLSWVALVAGIVALAMPAAVVGERAARRYEQKYYIAVDGHIIQDENQDPVFVGVADGFGAVRVSLAEYGYSEDVYAGNHLTLLVSPADRTDYILPGDRADPVGALGFGVVVAVVALLAAGAAFFVHRARRADPAAVGQVAVAIPPGGTPPPLTERLRVSRTGVVLRLVAAGVLLATAIPAALYAADDVHSVTAEATVPGEVVDGRDDAGNSTLSVRYYDGGYEAEVTRPLLPAERAQGKSAGDTIAVTYVESYATVGHGHDLLLAEWALVATLAALLLLKRALLWPRRLRRAETAAPQQVELTAWTRVALRHAWLVVAPPGTTKARKCLAVPLSNDREIPAAVTGAIYLQGRLKPGHAVILRAPNGALIAPAGPARRAFVAELMLVPAAPPIPPPAVAYGYTTVW